MSRYVEPTRARPWGAIFTPREPAPPDPPKEPEMDTAEAVARARYPAPYDIVEGARNVFKAHVLPRDVQGGRLSDGAERYFGQFYYSTMAGLQVEHGIPGSAEGWGHFSVQAFLAAAAAYDRDQRPAEPPPPVEFRGPISVAGDEFQVPS